MFKRLLNIMVLFSFIVTAQAQVPVKIVDGTNTEQMLGAPGRRVIYTMQDVPNSSTAVVTSTIRVVTLFCSNYTGGAVTLTITDNQGSPITYFPAVSLAANSAIMLVAQSGLTFTSGLKWAASASTSIKCQIEGVQ